TRSPATASGGSPRLPAQPERRGPDDARVDPVHRADGHIRRPPAAGSAVAWLSGLAARHGWLQQRSVQARAPRGDVVGTDPGDVEPLVEVAALKLGRIAGVADRARILPEQRSSQERAAHGAARAVVAV